MEQQPFVYSFVTRGLVVLAECVATGASLKDSAIGYLETLGTENKSTSIPQDNLTFYFLKENPFCYMVVAGSNVPIAKVNLFLDTIKKDFIASFAATVADAQVNSLDKEFGPKLKEHMLSVAKIAHGDEKIDKIKEQTTEVKELLINNVEKVLNRGEKLDELTGKAAELKEDALEFKETGAHLKNKFWWGNMKLKMIIALVALIIIAVVIYVILCKVIGVC